jgi:tripartite-type tricarboxylate transporter receptor subunit TctC
MKRQTFGRRMALATFAALALLPAAASAQAPWPTKPVKLIVPFAAGGPTDTVARLLAERLQAQWQQTVVIDYKPGAGTMVGTDFVAKSPADGYTLGMAITAHMINPSLQPKLPYDTTRDLIGVAQVAQAHFGLFAHPSLPVANVAELIAYAKKNPGKLSYATPGIGTGTHLAGEMLNHRAGIDMVHVPYKGSAPAQQDVLAGRVPLLFDVLFSAMPFVKDNRLKVIALSSPSRAVASPDIPLIAEQVPGFSALSFIGVIAPAGVTKDLARRISADIQRAVKSPELTERMAALGMEPVGSSPDEYDAVIKAEIAKWTQVVKAANIKLE